jgi:putative DNA primase/helicase
VYIEFLDNKKFPKKGADMADNPEAFNNAGYVLTETDLVIDVDNIEKPVIEKLIRMFNIKTQTVWTNRGAHFYFKKPVGFKGSKKVCPLGFEVEYKHIANTKYITVKQDGKLRIVDNPGIREELPEVFYSKRKLESLLGMSEHDGRNQALYIHRMKIGELDQWKNILRFINHNVFADPLPEEEFKEVSRDGIKIDPKKNSEPEIADMLLAKYKAVSYNGKIYWLENGEFLGDEDRLRRLVLAEVPLMKTRFIDEIIKYMKYSAPLIDPGKIFDIKLQNGILREGSFIPVNYQEFTPYSINIPYHAEAAPVEIVDHYLDHLTNNDPEYRKLILEVIAHTLIVNKDFKRMLAKFFIFIGDGGNGKGTLLLLIRKILGYKNCSGLSIKNMTDERYFTTMQGKLANLGDDVQDEAINNEQMKMLKNISTCDFVSTRNLFEQSREVELTLTLIFTSNHILKSFEKGEAYKRRVSWLPIFGKPAKKDKNFVAKLTTPEALEYWLKLIVEAYKRLYKNEAFTFSEAVEEFNAEYHKENNSVLLFLADYDKNYFLNKRSPEVYEEYEQWAEENGLSVQSKKLFVKSVYDEYGLVIAAKKINGKTARVFLDPSPFQKQEHEPK